MRIDILDEVENLASDTFRPESLKKNITRDTIKGLTKIYETSIEPSPFLMAVIPDEVMQNEMCI